MADSGDRETPNGPPQDAVDASDLDAEIGFASPQALVGRPRAPEPEPVAEPEPAPEPEALPAAKPVAPEPEPEASPTIVSPPAAPPADGPVADAAASPMRHAPSPGPGRSGGGRRKPPVAEAPMGLYAVYALILFAVPTLGASAVVGLAAVALRDAPDQEPWAGHHVFQLRTLWTAAVAALLGAILIVVNLGVFVLFALVVWLVIRGAWGVWLLTGGRPVPRPRSWLI